MSRKSKNLSIALIIASIAIMWVVLLSGCVDINKEPEPQILNLTMCSDVINPYNDSRFLLPEEETCSSVFNENSEIYICGNITTSINGNQINIKIYKIFNKQSILLNVSIPETYADLNETYKCVNLSLLLLKEGDYKAKYILGGGKNKKEKDITFKILRIQEQDEQVEWNETNNDTYCHSNYYNKPYKSCQDDEKCAMCPNCDYCSSVGCHSIEFCSKIGFNKSWFDSLGTAAITTESQAITIANATEEVKEFLKFYPDAKVFRVFHTTKEKPLMCCDGPEGLLGGAAIGRLVEGRCNDATYNYVLSECKNEQYGIVYALSNTSNTFVIIIINGTNGEILAKYLRMENIKNVKYCEEYSDCMPTCAYGCVNNMLKEREKKDCEGMPTYKCECINNTCVAIETEKPSTNNTKPTQAKNVVEANNQFAFDLYSKFNNEEGNIFFSPYSISTALAMTYEGAKGKTAEEMQNVLHLPDDKEKIHSDFAGINKELNKANKSYNLSVANALWAQNDYKFLDEYFKTVERSYGGKVTNLDFVKETEKSRQTINSWVENQTNNKIKNLIPQGVLNDMTRLVLTNAIYFKGTWANQFDKKNTREADFRVNPEKNVKVQMMSLTGEKAIFNYTETEELQILELPYEGNELLMLVILPKGDNLTFIENSICVKNLSEWQNNLRENHVDVYLPKFKFEIKYSLSETLKEMGMPTAFSNDAAAPDFSGIDGTHELFISEVIHQAFVEVNEEGTEAAAATAVVMRGGSIHENKIFYADHPFIFIIQDKKTGNILFLGRVTDPGKN